MKKQIDLNFFSILDHGLSGVHSINLQVFNFPLPKLSPGISMTHSLQLKQIVESTGKILLVILTLICQLKKYIYNNTAQRNVVQSVC